MQSGEAGTRTDRYLRCLAMLPISFLSEQGDRLAGLCGCTVVADNYRDLFASSVWMYSLHAYMRVVREQLGGEVARAVWSLQRDMFDETQAGVGQSMETAFMLIDWAGAMTGIGEADAVGLAPPEHRVAVALLLGMPESPDYAGAVRECLDRSRTAPVEDCLARCLLQARDALLCACSPLFERNDADDTGLLKGKTQ